MSAFHLTADTPALSKIRSIENRKTGIDDMFLTRCLWFVNRDLIKSVFLKWAGMLSSQPPSHSNPSPDPIQIRQEGNYWQIHFSRSNVGVLCMSGYSLVTRPAYCIPLWSIQHVPSHANLYIVHNGEVLNLRIKVWTRVLRVLSERLLKLDSQASTSVSLLYAIIFRRHSSMHLIIYSPGILLF